MAEMLDKGLQALKKVILEFNPNLAGNFEPVQDELVVHDLQVSGEIPKDLTGIYMRNGPNPQFPPLLYIWPFDGDGMIHAVYIADGKAQYRNRYVETKALLKERRAGKTLYGSLARPAPLDPKWADPEDEPVAVKNGSHICIIRHAGQYLSLDETNPGYQVTKYLQTIGEWDPGQTGQPIRLSPHTRLDPFSGDLWVVNYDLNPPYLTLYRIDNKGHIAQRWDIEKSHCSLVHDFVLTEHYAVIFDCPAVFDINKRLQGEYGVEWQPELGVQIGVMPKAGGKMQWFRTDPFFVFHFANAYERQEEIIIDYMRYDKVIVGPFEADDVLPHLYRTIVNLRTGSVKNTQMDDRDTEFPRIREDRDTVQHRFVYSPTKTPVFPSKWYHALVKYDLEHHRHAVHEFGRDAQIDEAVFAPASSPTSEDDGYLMLFVYNNETNQSELVILDAQNMKDEPLARVHMPRRIPHGLHGSWMSGPWQGPDTPPDGAA